MGGLAVGGLVEVRGENTCFIALAEKVVGFFVVFFFFFLLKNCSANRNRSEVKRLLPRKCKQLA